MGKKFSHISTKCFPPVSGDLGKFLGSDRCFPYWVFWVGKLAYRLAYSCVYEGNIWETASTVKGFVTTDSKVLGNHS